MIAISSISFGEDVEREVLDTLRSGMVAQGPKVARFEVGFAELVGTRHAVAVNSGTTALIAALRVLDLQPGDEVLTTQFTFVATLNAILDSGATARFADIGEADFALDPDAVAQCVNERTRVLMPVHLYGQTADMGALMPLAETEGLAVVEDAAQAHGATFDGKGAGSFGLGCFSFYATKNLTTAEGGMVTTDDDGGIDPVQLVEIRGPCGVEPRGDLPPVFLPRFHEQGEVTQRGLRENAGVQRTHLAGSDERDPRSRGRHHASIASRTAATIRSTSSVESAAWTGMLRHRRATDVATGVGEAITRGCSR